MHKISVSSWENFIEFEVAHCFAPKCIAHFVAKLYNIICCVVSRCIKVRNIVLHYTVSLQYVTLLHRVALLCVVIPTRFTSTHEAARNRGYNKDLTLAYDTQLSP